MAFVVCLSVDRAVVCVFSRVAKREPGAGRGAGLVTFVCLVGP